MTVSGIVMACRPEHLEEMSGVVNAFDWAEVHYTDRDGRLVVTIDASDIEESMDHLKELKKLPRAIMAELAEFVVEE